MTYDSGLVFQDFVASLGLSSDSAVELVVVDSGSRPEHRIAVSRICEKAGGTFVQVTQNVGYGVGSNIGAESAHGEWLAFVNPDVWISVGELRRMIEVAEANGLACVGPRIDSPDGQAPPSARQLIRPFWRPAGPSDFPLVGDVVLAPSMSGCCMAVRADTFAGLGGFDPRFFMFAEEIDLHARIADAGGRLGVVPSVAAVTPGAASSEGVPARWSATQRGVSHVLYSHKHFGPIAALASLTYQIIDIIRRPYFKPRRASYAQLFGELAKARRTRGVGRT